MTAIDTLTLNDGRSIPAVGLGTYGLRGEEGIASLLAGIEAGYRLLDTAMNYGNEREVGEAVRRSGVPREDFVITSKLPGRHHGYEETLASFEESRQTIGLDYLDLYLIHWPLPKVDKYVESFRAFLKLREDGVLRSAGVSNFTEAQLRRVVEETGVAPAVNQVELHPYFPQAALRAVHAELGVQTESWSPLGKGSDLFRAEPVVRAAEAHGVTPSQVVVRWHVQLGTIPIPKSGNPDRQRENLDVFGFSLDDDEVAAISGLENGRLWDADPDTHEEF
ncbi:aldo/keto reductase [Naasia aerilata]|uniref:Oxidoreductase n=1 Tax=Naasia aerilata TaxID=1162966 RepID=A0ABM8GGZ6_9MICO|nr:aldo/keto reductase [Naasia aerilata]BDZ47646.1 oxidoreductase [Naasia aerilata]